MGVGVGTGGGPQVDEGRWWDHFPGTQTLTSSCVPGTQPLFLQTARQQVGKVLPPALPLRSPSPPQAPPPPVPPHQGDPTQLCISQPRQNL